MYNYKIVKKIISDNIKRDTGHPVPPAIAGDLFQNKPFTRL
jgi:hypothetical protein